MYVYTYIHMYLMYTYVIIYVRNAMKEILLNLSPFKCVTFNFLLKL